VLESAIYLVARTRQLRSNIWCLLADERTRPPCCSDMCVCVSSISYNVMHLCILDVVVYHYSELSALTFVLEFG
jgi:hypothetical protein